jgi:tetratricopeptide (TPR) repeat protein
MITANPELGCCYRLVAALQTPAQESKWLPEFVTRITPTGWVVIGVIALVVLGVILYFFTIDELELGIPPKVKFKRRVRSPKEQAAPPPDSVTSPSPRQAAPDQPTPPPLVSTTIQPNLVHPYPLQANFTGRVKEREELTEWLVDNEHPICALVAMGGMGKSALAWYWAKNDVLTSSDMKLDGLMWWSFYEGESSFAKFVDDALTYVSNKPIDAVSLPTTYDRAQELRKQLQQRKILFVLDGFERQLRDYASLDAAYKSDDSAERSREARSCVDPITSRLLRDVAAGTTKAKVLITTRLPVSDLEDRANDPLAGVVERELRELARDDAVAFMHAQGVKKGTDVEIANVCEAYGYHPLSLRLLSGLIARDAKTPGDIAAAPRHDVYDDLVQRQNHVLEESYNALQKRERALLSRIAAFRGPMAYDALEIFRNTGEGTRFEAALDDLRVRGLLQRDIAHNRYDLHPIVRHYAYDRLTDKNGVHTRLRDYFAKVPAADTNKVKSIEDLAPFIELYYHTVRAGRYDEGCNLYYQRIWDLLYYRLGAYKTQIELLMALLPASKEQKPRLKKESDQAWTMSEIANAYGASGQSRNAMIFFQKVIAIYERLGDKQNIAIGLDNIATQQINLGVLASSERNRRRSIALCKEINSESDEAFAHEGLGRLLAFRGAFDEAELELESAQGIVDKFGVAQTNAVSTVRAELAMLLLLKKDYKSAYDIARQALTLALAQSRSIYGGERDIVRAEWLWGAALVMEGKDMDGASEHLTDALTRGRRINLVEFEPDILLAWARWHRARGNAQEAQTHAEDALAIADRCEYRLKQADIHNFLARLALDAGDQEKAREHAEIAKERAWCDGPPHCYKPALDEAEVMWKELGARV